MQKREYLSTDCKSSYVNFDKGYAINAESIFPLKQQNDGNGGIVTYVNDEGSAENSTAYYMLANAKYRWDGRTHHVGQPVYGELDS